MDPRALDDASAALVDSVPFIRTATLLLDAVRFAADLACDPWEFAVEIEELRATGLSNNGLRWLLHKGYVRRALEVASPNSTGRTFQPADGQNFPASMCFLLTEAGLPFAEAHAAPARALVPAPTLRVVPGTEPVWDPDRQELRMGDAVVKQFKVPAPNQEIVLASFQEEGWPVRIDDPLPPLAGLEPKRRLHETITSLNRNRKRRLISFHGDGSGEGVRWQPAIGRSGRAG
jgi:hypothetical protein